MLFVIYTIHVVISIFLILVVLLQQGKGADLSVFGGGGTQAAFGARGAATVLHKLTVICFVMFIVTTLSIGILKSRSAPSVMGGVESTAPAPADEESETPTGPAGGVLPTEETAPPPAQEDGTTASSEGTEASEDAAASDQPVPTTPPPGNN